mmetsp:Transcript_10724/g.33079  ORF Transcript_10724/g.33079 Transcript_10724/m.33079 type:complete len:266 (+) Transcript_10724:626-1423(+)
MKIQVRYLLEVRDAWRATDGRRAPLLGVVGRRARHEAQVLAGPGEIDLRRRRFLFSSTPRAGRVDAARSPRRRGGPDASTPRVRQKRRGGRVDAAEFFPKPPFEGAPEADRMYGVAPVRRRGRHREGRRAVARADVDDALARPQLRREVRQQGVVLLPRRLHRELEVAVERVVEERILRRERNRADGGLVVFEGAPAGLVPLDASRFLRRERLLVADFLVVVVVAFVRVVGRGDREDEADGDASQRGHSFGRVAYCFVSFVVFVV